MSNDESNHRDMAEPPSKFVIPMSLKHGLHASSKALKCTVSTPGGKVLQVEALAPGADMSISINEAVHIIVEVI